MQPRNLKKKDRDKVQGVQDRPASLRASAETPATATEGEEKKERHGPCFHMESSTALAS